MSKQGKQKQVSLLSEVNNSHEKIYALLTCQMQDENIKGKQNAIYSSISNKLNEYVLYIKPKLPNI